MTAHRSASRELDGKVALVTGAGSGIGYAIAGSFASEGAVVAIDYLGHEADAQALARDSNAAGAKAVAIGADVTDAAAVEALVAEIVEQFGRLDVLVNNAGIEKSQPLLEIDEASCDRTPAVDLKGLFHCLEAAARRMNQSGGGSIENIPSMLALKRMVARDMGTVVQVGSALAYRAVPLQSTYRAARFGMRGFTDSVRAELMPDGSNVWITMVQLPPVNRHQFNWYRTKLPDHPQPVPPIFRPEIPVEAAYGAAHHRRRELDVGGSTVEAIFGNRLSPRFADWHLAKTGYESQQIPGMPVNGRPDNFVEPVPDEAATHGILDNHAHARSYQLWENTHRPLVAGVLTGVAAAGVALARTGC